ncbi:MAG: AAA family ATPase [Bryobacteraceae bacterium]|nr:AAA family ATPase [Bryobacteraceae bacterium]
MLTRLRVKGFKNLVDIDVRFGPFTCIAGENGVGKSNLFDAITFLSRLADRPLIEAAMSIRDEPGRAGDPRGIFHHSGSRYADHVEFDAEMIVPREGTDDLGQDVEATTTFLTYGLTIRYRKTNGASGLEVLREELKHIPKGQASQHLRFPHKARGWRDGVVTGTGTAHRTAPFISTEPGEGVVLLHQDKQGRPRRFRAETLPRTVLSTANASEGATVTLARRELQSWRLIQLEPSSLRRSSPFQAPVMLGADGANLASTLHHLAKSLPGRSGGEERVFSEVAHRLAELIDDVKTVSVDIDEKRELFTVQVTSKDGTVYPAKALSDGTLRFLALAVLAQDPSTTGVLCMEEPENGIHPSRIPAMISLLESIALSPHDPSGLDNPLRQVIVNTHSPLVVQEVNAADLLFAYLRERVRPSSQERYRDLAFGCLEQTWRAQSSHSSVVPRSILLPYMENRRVSFPRERDFSMGQPRPMMRLGDVLQQMKLSFGAGERG